MSSVPSSTLFNRLLICATSITLFAAGRGAAAQDAGSFAVFGGRRVIFESFSNTLGAPVGSNGDIRQLGGIGNFASLRGGGEFIGDKATQNVSGDMTFGGSILTGVLSKIGGSINPGASVAPVAVPPGTTFAPGSADIFLNTFDQKALLPGSYRDLLLQGSNKLFLSSGDYYFDRITSIGAFLDLNLDLSHGPINIHVAGPVTLESVNPVINGVAFDKSDPLLAKNVLLETHDDALISGDFFGTIFAPNGDIRLDALGQIDGSVIASGQVLVGASTDITYVRSANAAIPEPASIALLAIGSLILVARRRA